MEIKQIAIYGASGFGREVAWLIQEYNESKGIYKAVCFIDDNKNIQGKMVNGIEVLDVNTASTRFPKAFVTFGIGMPKIRQAIVEKLANLDFKFETIIHPSVRYSQLVKIGEGSIICAGTILTVNIVLGKHVHINLNCTVGHDVIIGEYTTISPGVHVSGCVRIGKRVFIGTGAVIINGTQASPLTKGDDVIIGAAACVTRSISEGQTVVGVPAKSIGKT